ncbi:hypothetical protein KY321_01595, partial [Candidatus Woesearchaeota archaeon]|nr:hypothetical protein [Candidatus Woesearchaeota archaeon]
HKTRYDDEVNVTGNIEKNLDNYIFGSEKSYVLYFKNDDKFLSICKHLPEVTFLEDEDYGCTNQLSDMFSISCNNSVQNRVEELALSYFESCIGNVSENIVGYKLSNEELKKIKVSSIFAQNTIEFFIKGDILLVSDNSKELITLPGINSFNYNIGLKSFYSREFKDVLEKECLEEDYDFKENVLDLFLDDVFIDATYDSYMVEEIMFDGNLYDVITFQLDASYSNTGFSGDYFNFTFARENREPVLTDVMVNSSHIKFTVFDPDEDLMKVTLSSSEEVDFVREDLGGGQYLMPKTKQTSLVLAICDSGDLCSQVEGSSMGQI